MFAHVVDCTGWTWTEAEREIDLHRLAALSRQWLRQPPISVLVSAYLGYKPPAPKGAEADDGELSPQHLMPGAGIPASEAFAKALTPEQAIEALERQFFGEVKNVEQI